MAENRFGGGYRREDWRERESSIFSDDDDRRGTSRWSSDYGRERGRDDDRGFFERAGDEVRSWFGDEEAERRRERDSRHDEGRPFFGGDGRSRESSYRSNEGGTSGVTAGYGTTFGIGSGHRSEMGGGAGDRDTRVEYRTGGRTEQGRESFGGGRSHWDDNYRRWRDQQVEQFDREYDDYCRERQQQFEQDFHNWRSSRAGQGTSGAQRGGQTGGGSATGYSGASTVPEAAVGTQGTESASSGGTGSEMQPGAGSSGATGETGEVAGRGRGSRTRT